MGKSTAGEIGIAIIGRGKVGKSLLLERIISPQLISERWAESSKLRPLSKRLRLWPSGPEVIINLASIEEDKANIEERAKKCIMAISESDIVIIVLDARTQLSDSETYLISYLEERKVSFLIAINKIEFGTNLHLLTELDALETVYFEISCKENAGLDNMKKKLIHLLPSKQKTH